MASSCLHLFFALSLVVRLCLGIGPAAIAGFVVAVIVDAIERHTRGALTHILKKRWERGLPPLANCDAAAAVASEVVATRVGTPVLHVQPGGIKQMILKAVLECPISLQTPA